MRSCDVCFGHKQVRFCRGILLCVDCRYIPTVLSIFDLTQRVLSVNGKEFYVCYSRISKIKIMREVRSLWLNRKSIRS